MPETRTTLGDIAATGAQARGVLLHYQLDFCCGGGRTLAAACESAAIDSAEVVEALRQATDTKPDSTDWSQASTQDLIGHILQRYHQPLPQQLNGVIVAAEKVERVHAAKPDCPTGLAEHLRRVAIDLTHHMAKEEQILFPALARGHRGPMLRAPVSVMLQEHDDHGDNLKRMRTLAHDFQPPAEACGTWRALYENLAALEADLMAHIHLENHILFPRAVQS